MTLKIDWTHSFADIDSEKKNSDLKHKRLRKNGKYCYEAEAMDLNKKKIEME